MENPTSDNAVFPTTSDGYLAEMRDLVKFVVDSSSSISASTKRVKVKQYSIKYDPTLVRGKSVASPEPPAGAAAGLATVQVGPLSLAETEAEVSVSDFIKSFDPALSIEPVKSGVVASAPQTSFPVASFPDLVPTSEALLALAESWHSSMDEGPKKLAVLTPFLVNLRAIGAAARRALGSVQGGDDSRLRDAIAAELASANAALSRAAALAYGAPRSSGTRPAHEHTAACNHGKSQGGPVWAAAKLGSAEGIREALARGGSTEDAANESPHNTAIITAALDGHAEAVAALIDAGADLLQPIRPNEKSERGLLRSGSLLHALASSSGLLSVLCRLVAPSSALHARINDRNKDDMTPLMLAASKGLLDTCRALVDAGADVTDAMKLSYPNSHITPLQEAARCGSLPVVEFLLSLPTVEAAFVNLGRDSNALCIAARGCHTAVVTHLLGDPRVKLDDVLTAAVDGGNENIVKLILADPRVDPRKYQRVFHSAATKGHVGILRILLDDPRGLNPTWQDTPVGSSWATEEDKSAVWCVQVEATRVLLADSRVQRTISAKDKMGRTAADLSKVWPGRRDRCLAAHFDEIEAMFK